MKQLIQYITERLQLNKERITNKYQYFPERIKELKDIIENITNERLY